jgi:hypothetical protein
MLLSYLPLFAAAGQPINAASILPGLLKSFGDIPDVLAQIAPRKTLVSAGVGKLARDLPSVTIVAEGFSTNPRRLTDWLSDEKATK